jgi:uncharacterized peroxidase-related enzyme
VAAVARDHRNAGLPARQVTMLDFVAALSEQPPRASRDAVDGLRSHGWSDRAILDIVQVAAYYAYVNRIADGLGVELEEFWPEEVRAADPHR